MIKYFVVAPSTWCNTLDERRGDIEALAFVLRPEIEKWFEILNWEIIERESTNSFDKTCLLRGQVKKLETWKGYAGPKLHKILSRLA